MLDRLHTISQGDSSICVAVLDGPVDQAHPCFQGANLTYLPTLVQEAAKVDGSMSMHGTHVASILFGQPGSPVQGIVPQCKGIIIPIFADDRRRTSQLDLARESSKPFMPEPTSSTSVGVNSLTLVSPMAG